ncbi:nicotinamide riboside transporter PnuC [Pedobacter sp. MR2016-24]|uniref:nicotinamide riboside transporter PnuC n=1 Tax=Pedobacter sp. MR2016-24 TaxID=2994466 RepID=UPI0022468911|nr:nicotinamide riboside transporter PnuC [Pedobacter sp. MR2016-24]MCX2482090.1 nicotinamide riboside transporter PnuC [Pedobacter sp. MR2016-24]
MTLTVGTAILQAVDYLIQSGWLEWAGVFTGILCVWLAAKNNILNWPIAIVSVLIYTLIFFETRLYSDMGLQVYFLLMNIYGWYFWSKKKNAGEKPTPVISITKPEIILSVIAVILLTLIPGFLLHQNTKAAYPYIDSFCTACSLVAQVFLARKVLQNWLIWIFVDIIYVAVYLSKGLYPTAMMYTLYIYIAWMGYQEWKKTLTAAHD